MHVQATLFSRILQHLPSAGLDRAVAEQRMDKGPRALDARFHLVALMAGQLIEATLQRRCMRCQDRFDIPHPMRRIEPACRSTLADANKAHSLGAFEAVIHALLTQLSPTKVRRRKETLRLVDSTLVHPGSGARHWAHFQNGKVAAKVHVAFDPKAQVPIFYELTLGNTNNITVAKSKMPIEAGATYVFDLGYYDFVFWAELDGKGIRLKKNTPVTVVAERLVPAGTDIPCDKIIRLPECMAASRKNPFADPGRMIVVMTDTGKPLKLFTNDLDSSAEAVAGLYKTRWQIELFFRWIKQNLRIRRFHSRSENAVQLQIAAAVITYLLWKLSHTAARAKKTAAVFLTALRNALFHRIELETLGDRIERWHALPGQVPSAQLEFAV